MKPTTLTSVVEQYATDDRCREALVHLRWPDGVACPSCGGKHISRVYDRNVFDCDSCRYQFSVLAGTIFHDTHLPLTKWFLATYLMCESRKGISANQMKRMLGVSYKTAWYLCHRIRTAMGAVKSSGEKLDGTIELDETYVGGKRRGTKAYGRTRATDGGKEVVFGIRQREGETRFFHVADIKSGTLAKYIRENVSTDVDVLLTDDLMVYPAAFRKAGLGRKPHHRVNHSAGDYGSGEINTNTVESAFSLLKRGIIGSWHRLSAKHLQAYLNEMTWRFDNRKNPYLFRDTLKCMLNSDNMEYKDLTAA